MTIDLARLEALATPGPWTMHTRLSGSENDRGWTIHGGKHGQFIAEVSPWIKTKRGDASEEGQANATLIAAMPDLLRELIAARAAITAMARGLHADGYRPDVDEAYRMLANYYAVADSALARSTPEGE